MRCTLTCGKPVTINPAHVVAAHPAVDGEIDHTVIYTAFGPEILQVTDDYAHVMTALEDAWGEKDDGPGFLGDMLGDMAKMAKEAMKSAPVAPPVLSTPPPFSSPPAAGDRPWSKRCRNCLVTVEPSMLGLCPRCGAQVEGA